MGTVGSPDPAAQFADWRRNVERQLAALATSRRSEHAAIAGGKLTVIDDDSNTVASFGRFDVESFEGATVEQLGFEVVDPATGVVLVRSTLEDGVTAPRHEVSWTPFEDVFKGTTSGTFAPVWITRSMLWPSSAVMIGTNVTVAGAATTGDWEARVKIGSEATGTVYTDVIAGSDSERVVWDVDLKALGYPVGVVDVDFGLRFDLELRRLTGTGTIFAELPYPILARDATTEKATPGGL